MATEKHYLMVGRMATVVIVILGILWIPVMKGIGKVLYEYLQDVQSLLAPGIAAVFLLGILSKRTTPSAGFIGLVVGFILGMLQAWIENLLRGYCCGWFYLRSDHCSQLAALRNCTVL